MRKKYLLVVTAVMMVVFSGCLESKKDDVVKIGFNLPITGQSSFKGEEFKRGVDLFPLPENVQIIIEDNQSNAAQAANIAKKFYSLNKVDVVISLFAPLSASQRDISQDYKKPLISTLNPISSFTENFQYCYVDYVQFAQLLVPVTDYVKEHNLNNGATLCVNDEFGAVGSKMFNQYLAKHGIALSENLFGSGATVDIKNMVVKTLAQKPEFVLVIAREMDIVTVINAIRERDPNIPILGTASFDSPTIWNNVNEAYQNNTFFSSSYFDKNFNEASADFYKKFVEKYKIEPHYPSIYAYSILQYLSKAIENSKMNKTALIDELNKTDYESIRGNLTIDDKREVYTPITFYTRKNNQNVIINVMK